MRGGAWHPSPRQGCLPPIHSKQDVKILLGVNFEDQMCMPCCSQSTHDDQIAQHNQLSLLLAQFQKIWVKGNASVTKELLAWLVASPRNQKIASKKKMPPKNSHWNTSFVRLNPFVWNVGGMHWSSSTYLIILEAGVNPFIRLLLSARHLNDFVA